MLARPEIRRTLSFVRWKDERACAFCSTAIRKGRNGRRGERWCVLRDGADCGSLDDERASMRLASIHLHRETMRWMTRRMSRIKKNQERGSLIIVTLIHTHVWHARAVVAAISYRGN